MFTITNEKEVQPVGCVLPNTLVHGDCLEVMKYIPDASIDLVLCDPPYGWLGTTACKWDSIIPLEPMWEQLKRVIKPNGAIVMTASQPFTTTLIASNMREFRYDIVWRKVRVTGHLNAKKMPLREHESVIVFYRKLPTYNPQMTPSKGHIRGPRGKRAEATTVYGSFLDDRQSAASEYYPRSTVEFRSDMQPVHPTQKPVSLMEYLIKTYTQEGETVLDFVMGSGTTGLAAKNLNRKFIGIEKDEKYFEIAKQRIGV